MSFGNFKMSKGKVKLGIAIGMGLGILILGVVGLRKLFAFEASFRQGADVNTALSLVEEIKPESNAELMWQPDDPNTGRSLDPFTRDAITSDYLHAWRTIREAYLLEREQANLKTYFTGSAYEHTLRAVQDAVAEGWLVRQKSYNHHLKLHFFSTNRSIVSFTDENFTLVRQVRELNGGNLISTTEEQLTAEVVMFFNEGYWQIRHLQVSETRLPEPLEPLAASDYFVRTRDNQFVYRDQLFKLHGFNYYPQQTPWDEFWPEFDAQVIDNDMDLMRRLGSNTIRIFIPFHQFGYDPINAVYMERLEQFLDLAQDHNLFVIVTLFDRRTDYNIETWVETDAHLEQLIPQFVDHPAILAWDIKNEGDKDYETASRGDVIAWVEHVAHKIRSLDTNHLITAGWFDPQAVPDVAAYVDFLSFHYFNYVDALPGQIDALQTRYPDKPILLEEFGAHTRWGLMLDAHSEQEQAYYYGSILKVVEEMDIAGSLAWTLYDFPDVLETLGKTGDSVENHLGLVRLDGSFKLAVEQFIPGGNLDVPPPTWVDRLRKPIYLAAMAVGGGGGVFIVFVWQVYRRRA